MGEPRVGMGDGRGLEVLMTEGWPTMLPMGGWWWWWEWLIGPEESVEESTGGTYGYRLALCNTTRIAAYNSRLQYTNLGR